MGEEMKLLLPLLLLSAALAGVECSEEDTDTAEVDAVGGTAFMVNGDRAMAGGMVPPVFEGMSDKARQYVGEWQEIRRTVPPLFFDGFSHLLFNNYTWKIYESFLSYETFDQMDDRGVIMGMRTLFVDAQVQQAIEAGTRQIVYLGSGLDTKALRLHSPAVRTWEVDREAVLAYKQKRLAKAGFVQYPAELIYGDYFQMDLLRELQKAGLEPQRPVLVVWEGNQMYIPVPKTKELLNSIFSSIPQATVVFDSVAAEDKGNTDVVINALYEVMNGGKVMWPGRTDALALAADLGAKVLRAVTLGAFAVETLGSEAAMNRYVLDHPDRIKFLESFGQVMSFNVITKDQNFSKNEL